jgi:hypothetical protein
MDIINKYKNKIAIKSMPKYLRHTNKQYKNILIKNNDIIINKYAINLYKDVIKNINKNIGTPGTTN